MLKLIGFIISICLIILIFLRIPQENIGLSSFASKNSFLGSSPSSAERSLNILTIFLILIYFGIAIELNLSNI
jgi:preprotein translocase subunit SecG